MAPLQALPDTGRFQDAVKACHPLGALMALRPLLPRLPPVAGWLRAADRSCRPQVCAGPDVEELLAEVQEARSLLGHIQALHRSGPGEELTGGTKEVGGGESLGPALEARSRPHPVLLPSLPSPVSWGTRQSLASELQGPQAVHCAEGPGGPSN